MRRIIDPKQKTKSGYAPASFFAPGNVTSVNREVFAQTPDEKMSAKIARSNYKKFKRTLSIIGQ